MLEFLIFMCSIGLFLTVGGITLYGVTTRKEVERTKRELAADQTQRIGMQNAFEIEQEKLSIMREAERGKIAAIGPSGGNGQTQSSFQLPQTGAFIEHK